MSALDDALGKLAQHARLPERTIRGCRSTIHRIARDPAPRREKRSCSVADSSSGHCEQSLKSTRRPGWAVSNALMVNVARRRGSPEGVVKTATIDGWIAEQSQWLSYRWRRMPSTAGQEFGVDAGGFVGDEQKMLGMMALQAVGSFALSPSRRLSGPKRISVWFATVVAV